MTRAPGEPRSTIVAVKEQPAVRRLLEPKLTVQ